MVFTNKKNSITPMNISIDRCSIEKVKCTKFLGVYIDDKLTWKKHITYITSKASRGLGVMLKARKLLNLNAMKTLYFSFIYP